MPPVRSPRLRAMVLAAGFGLRMWPLTLLRAKPVLPVLNRPLLHWTLERLARHGVGEVVVNLHHLPESVTSALGDGRAFGLRIRYSREREILGTAGGPRAVRELFGDEPFLLVNGDMLFDFDLRALVARHHASGARATLALRPNPDPRAYGAVITDRRGRIRAIKGRPRRTRGTISLFAGVHVLDPTLLDLLPPGRSDSVHDLYVPLLGEGAFLQGVRVRGAWYDLGRPRLYRDTQLRLMPGRGRDRCLVDPGAGLGPGARVRRSVIGRGARVAAAARVERSVVWEDARVERDARLEGALVVTGAVVREGEHAQDVVVLPTSALAGAGVGGKVERRGDMTWVALT
jgi:NDP-sugar pyrophosphorylase family protein